MYRLTHCPSRSELAIEVEYAKQGTNLYHKRLLSLSPCSVSLDLHLFLCVLLFCTGSGRWLSDGGLLHSQEHLPVTAMIFLQQGGKANVTLGPLQCVGTGMWYLSQIGINPATYLCCGLHLTPNAIPCYPCTGGAAGHYSSAMFTTEASHLQLPGWRGGDMRFRFRTMYPNALLLFQPSSNSQETEQALMQQAQLLLTLHDGQFWILFLSSS